MKTIGEKIKELRRSKGMSQKEFGDLLAVTSQAVSKWENNSALPEMTMLPNIASIFGIQIDDLFEYSKEKRYESIASKISVCKSLGNSEFANDESFLLREIEQKPECYEAISLLGDLYRQQAENMKKRSVHYAKMALDLRPNQKGDISNINACCNGYIRDWCFENHQELIDLYFSLLRKNPENKLVYYSLMDNLIDAGRLDEASALLIETRRKNPCNKNDYYEILIRERKYGFENVIVEYERLMKQYESDWWMLSMVADAYCYNEKYEEAIAILRASFEHMEKPRYTDVFESMAQCAIRMGDRNSAISFYQEKIKLLAEDWNTKFGEEVDRIQEKISLLKTNA